MEAGDSKKRPRGRPRGSTSGSSAGGSTSGSSAGGPPPPSPKKITVDMAEKMSDVTLKSVLEFATTGFEKYSTHGDAAVAEYIKSNLDVSENKSWHCIIGDFSMSVSHEEGKFAILSREGKRICVYKTSEAASAKVK